MIGIEDILAERPTLRELREQELRAQLASNSRLSNTENIDLSQMSDTELDGLISIAGRKSDQPRKRMRRR